ncbi:4-hydroxybenzoate octaprenyltransferase [Candidatus Pelagibacter sp.]|nr:4-hydroxybenzoate octaprenyltransferase [Candidatus Pelagibacter sp.]
MKQLNLFIELTRLKRPIGYMLLFWPCAWGLTLAYDFSKNLNDYFFYLSLFFLGSVLMRSAGCIVNDISDKEFDKKVSRTKNRPIASDQVTVKLGIFYTLILCLLAFLVLINFNNLTILLALSSMPLAFTYPLMKRFTYWPQLFLGITFNYGLVLGWTAIQGEINTVAIIFYFGAIFWTLGYDTIYGFQDIKDDEIIGVKSTSIKFKKKPKNFVSTCYAFLSFSILIVGYMMNYNYFFYASLLITIAHLFFYQIKFFNSKNPSICLKVFKSNNLVGLLVFCNILIGKL